MTKILIAFVVLLAAIQIIRPLGWPGLQRRSDAWKLAVGGFVLIFAAAGLSLT